MPMPSFPRAARRPNLPPFVQRLAGVALFNSLIALLLSGGRAHLWQAFVYSQGIGLSIFGFAVLGARLFPRYWQRRWWPMLVFMPVSVVLGRTLGMWLADLALGNHALLTQIGKPEQFWALTVISLCAGGVATLYFLNREQIMVARTEAEAARRQAAEARLRLLESQLEPHMLFNTLANLRALIELDPPRAVAMLDSLNAFLRATLNGSRANMHPLAAEFERLRDYLELMVMRMGPRLSYTLDLPEPLRATPVPPLLLQTLVENSIRHGLEPKVEGGSITLRARQQAGGMVTLDVIDTGVGMADWPQTGGFGLAQVRERLATAYDGRASINLQAGTADGTHLRITLLQPDSATP